MTQPRLLTIQQAAEQLGLPEKSLLREAERHGHLVLVGRAKRIPESELGELIEKCRCHPKERGSYSEKGKDEIRSTLSKTAASQSVARAQQIANKLKSLSQTTSPAKTANLVRLQPTK